MKIIIYDLETTGLELTKDKIIEGYFYDIVNETCIHLICDPEIPIPAEVSKINGWTDLDIRGKKTFREELPNLLEFCTDDCMLIAHNNDNFDKLILLTNMINNGYKRPTNWKFIDTCKLANIAYPDMVNYKQETLQKKFKISIGNNHKANKDVLDLFKIYENICSKLELDPINDIKEICNLSRRWIPLKMMFGKHKGELISELPEDYKQWVKNNTSNRALIKAINKSH